MFKRIQRGRGRRAFSRVQRGRGLGGILSSIFRALTKAVPIAAKIARSPIAKKIGKEALKSGLRVGGEALVTNDLSSAVKNELGTVKERVGKALLKRGRSSATGTSKKAKKSKMGKQTGRGVKKVGKGKKRKIKKVKKGKTKKVKKVKNRKTKKIRRIAVDRRSEKNQKSGLGLSKISNIFSNGQKGSGEPSSRPRQRTTIFDM